MPIRLFGDPVLRTPARDVETFDDLLAKLCDNMLETMYEAPGVGLAAPQVGLAIRFFVFDAGDGSGPNAIANPVLSNLDGVQEDDEGCLSIPNLYFPTARALSAHVTGQDVKGRPIELEGEELIARIFQHETDHVNGTLFIDRLAPDERRKAMAEIRERELGGWTRPLRRPTE